MVHCLSMALPQRFTFISDPKDEFPNNTNHQFMVCLPVPLRLEGQWYASLWSLSVPDEPLQNKSLFADTSAVILDFKFTLYKLSGKSGDKYQTLTLIPKTSTLRVDNVMNNTTPAQTGVEFWQNCVRMIDETIAENVLEVKQNDSLLPVAIPNDWKPTFKWDGDDLVLEAVSSDSVVSSGASPFPYSWFGSVLWFFTVQQTIQPQHLTKKNIIYPVVRTSIRTFSIPSGNTMWEQDDVFLNKMPDRTLLAMVHTDAYNGDFTRYPFAFERFGAIWVRQTVNGEEYPYKTLELSNESSNKDSTDYLGYERFLQASGAYRERKIPMVQPGDWGEGKTTTLFLFNNVPSRYADDPSHRNPQQSGNVRYKINFASATSNNITVLVWSEYETLLEVNYEGAIRYNV